MFKNFFRFFINSGKNSEDLKPLTDFLKNNHNFQKVAHKIHYTKEGVKDKMMNSFEGLLKDEDDIKLIEDEHKKDGKKH